MEGLGMQEQKSQILIILPSPVNGFQVLLSSTTCPPQPQRKKVFALLFTPSSISASSNQQMTHKSPIPLLVPWV